jgi:vancomycin resistance protein VanJ
MGPTGRGRVEFIGWIKRRLVTLSRVYFTLLLGWRICNAVFKDRWGWLFLLNMFSLYSFAFIPLIALIAIIVRKKETWLGLALIVVVWVTDFGSLLLPKFPARVGDAESINVMTYNVLGTVNGADAILSNLRDVEADLIAFQELNLEVGEAIGKELLEEYPYQILDPRPYVFGAGTISRYPLRSTGETLPGEWLGSPQVLELEFNGRRVTIVNAHTYAASFIGEDYGARYRRLEWSVKERERQVQTLTQFARDQPQPLIVLLDLNVGEMTRAYSMMDEELQDAWNKKGWGLGHTHSLTQAIGFPTPLWLLRLDYVFCSDDWEVLNVQLGSWDGISDHRPLMAELSLKEP